jgi:hypothetical protein
VKGNAPVVLKSDEGASLPVEVEGEATTGGDGKDVASTTSEQAGKWTEHANWDESGEERAMSCLRLKPFRLLHPFTSCCLNCAFPIPFLASS